MEDGAETHTGFMKAGISDNGCKIVTAKQLIDKAFNKH